MNDHARLWAGVTAALLAGASMNGAALARDDGNLGDQIAKPGNAWVFAQSGEGERGGQGGGEGEGEGEGAGAALDPAVNDAAYLTLLALVRGHLLAGLTLYEAGHGDQAANHMRHPGDELYSQIAPALAARGAPDFGAHLVALGDAVSSSASEDEVRQAYDQAIVGVTVAERAVGASVSPALAVAVAVGLAQTAAEEYDIAVDDDGTVVNAHEYQDAWGFVQVAEALVAAQGDALPADVREEIASALSTLQGAFDGPVPGARMETEPSVLYGAAAELEIAALALD